MPTIAETSATVAARMRGSSIINLRPPISRGWPTIRDPRPATADGVGWCRADYRSRSLARLWRRAGSSETFLSLLVGGERKVAYGSSPDSPLEGTGFEPSVPAGVTLPPAHQQALIVRTTSAQRAVAFSSTCSAQRTTPSSRGRVRFGWVAVCRAARPGAARPAGDRVQRCPSPSFAD
jgi:hypothetical protein